jgi:hypothetical protein
VLISAPRAANEELVIAGGGHLVDSFCILLMASYSMNVAAFTFDAQASLMVWLLVKGRNVTLKGYGGFASAPPPAPHGDVDDPVRQVVAGVVTGSGERNTDAAGAVITG